MAATNPRAFVTATCLLFSSGQAALAHVKWFLGKSETEILKHAKPELFNSLCLANALPAALTILMIFVTTIAGRAFSNNRINRSIINLAEKREAEINLFIGICTGVFLVYCSLTRTLLAPNFIICEHCPQWLPAAEGLIGSSILFGLLTRVGALGLLALLSFTFIKHQLADCLDLLPLYGIAAYFLLAGRNRYCVDHWLMIDRLPEPALVNLAHLVLRWLTGIGLLILALDEKLLHPQLALELLKYHPSLNFVGQHCLSNDMFVLCAGFAELLLGLIVVVGSFPRFAAVMLLGTFAATTQIFGITELFGHLPFYGIACSLLLRGSGPAPALVIFRNAAAALASPLQGRSPAKQLA